MNNEIIKKLFNKKSAIVLIAAGIVILALSSLLSTPKEDKNQSDSTQISLSEYISDLEERLKKVVENIDGAGKCYVMITLSESGEKIYAKEEKNITNRENEGQSNEKYSKDFEQEYVIVNNNALFLKEEVPKICGVAIVCEGGENEKVVAKVTQAVSVLLGIQMKDIFVTKGV